LPSPKVFVSYSHKDTKALQELQPFLAPLVRAGGVSVWADAQLKAGDDWKQKILEALGEATVAVLLISQDFLASDFIVKEELPRILEREAAGLLKVLPVFLKPSQVKTLGFPDPRRGTVHLTDFQGFGTADKPLAKLTSVKRDEIYLALSEQLQTLTGPAPAAPAPGPRPVRGPVKASSSSPSRIYELTVAMKVRGETLHLSYHLPGREPIASATVSWKTVEETIRPIQDSLDRMRRQVLLTQLEDPNEWGAKLFGVLFPEDHRREEVFDALFGEPAGVRQNPSRHPVRLRICCEDDRLSGLPWRSTSWARQPLVGSGWVLTTTQTVDPTLDLLTPAPCHVLVVAPGDPDCTKAVLGTLTEVWPTGRDPGYFEVAGSRAELERALRVHRPHLLYVYGRGSVESNRPSLVLDQGELLSLADLLQMFRAVGQAPAVVYLDTEGLTSATTATPDQILLDEVPLLFWRRLPERPADGPAVFLYWLRRWLTRGEDPVDVFHAVHKEIGRNSSEACTVAIHSNYRSWQTKTVEGAAAARSHPALQIDRERPKAVVEKQIAELVRSNDRRVMAIVPYALEGRSVELFCEQLRHHLELSLDHLAAFRWVPLQFPPSRANLQRDLEEDLKAQLGAEPNESPRQLLRRWGPRAPGRRKPVLWLNWGTFGAAPFAPSLTDEQLAGWLRFAGGFLGPHCPDDLRIVAYLAQEVPEKLYKSFSQKLRELRLEPWCRTPVFRLSDGEPLEEVDVLHLMDFLEAPSSHCDPQIQREVAERIITSTGGAFAPTVALVEEAEATSWYALLTRLRREQGAA
jgi:hypothetical protein